MKDNALKFPDPSKWSDKGSASNKSMTEFNFLDVQEFHKYVFENITDFGTKAIIDEKVLSDPTKKEPTNQLDETLENGASLRSELFKEIESKISSIQEQNKSLKELHDKALVVEEANAVWVPAKSNSYNVTLGALGMLPLIGAASGILIALLCMEIYSGGSKTLLLVALLIASLGPIIGYFANLLEQREI